jgi:DNA recombination protein RmuC
MSGGFSVLLRNFVCLLQALIYMEILLILAGLIAGSGLCYLFLSARYSASRAALHTEKEIALQQLTQQEKALEQLREAHLKTSAEASRQQAINEELRKELAQKQQDIQQMYERLRQEFKLMAGDMLEEKSRKFSEMNQQQMQQLLQPVQERFVEFRQKVEETYDRESKMRFALEREIKQLYELNQQVTREAANLTTALRGQQKTQGNWGEFILERVLEQSGLTRGREYEVQHQLQGEEGRRLQPDVVIFLPEDRYIVVDAKVSLNAYERYVNHEPESGNPQPEESLRLHLLSVRQHVKQLSEKKYSQLFGNRSPDFTLMFMPVEPAFHLAVQHAPELFQEAFQAHIVLVSPTTLLATLRTVASIWRQEKQNKNAEEIARLGGALYDKLAGFMQDMQKISDSLDATRKSYDSAWAKLAEGRGNLLSRAERMKELGAKTSKQLGEFEKNSD